MLDSIIKLRKHDFNEKWVEYLFNTNKKSVNYERINSIREISNKNVYNYVLRTLEILDNKKDKYDDRVVYYVLETLKWSEVSKCGSNEIRKEWKNKNIDLYELIPSTKDYSLTRKLIDKDKTIISPEEQIKYIDFLQRIWEQCWKTHC